MKRSHSTTLLAAALSMILPATAFADPCADDVKRVLTNAAWTMTVKFNRGRTEEYALKTRVGEDGSMEVLAKGGRNMKITCSGEEIVFDWKNQKDKRFKLTLGKDGAFSGARTSSNGNEYPATLKKN